MCVCTGVCMHRHCNSLCKHASQPGRCPTTATTSPSPMQFGRWIASQGASRASARSTPPQCGRWSAIPVGYRWWADPVYTLLPCICACVAWCMAVQRHPGVPHLKLRTHGAGIATHYAGMPHNPAGVQLLQWPAHPQCSSASGSQARVHLAHQPDQLHCSAVGGAQFRLDTDGALTLCTHCCHVCVLV